MRVEGRTVTVWEQERALSQRLMEQVCERENVSRAYKRVRTNRGAPGVDGMKVEGLPAWWSKHGDALIQSLMDGNYRPQAVRGVEIPKPGGAGVRQLGIPTVIDRVIQQAIVQVLEPLLDPTFSESSYGFRPGRSAHDALKKAQEYVEEGRWVVVDLDLEKFFDRVNHDILMARLARRIGDKRLLKLIRRYLEAGMMKNGVCIDREEGTPQGGPASPILANLLLDDLDKELERRGHKFCRYADDCNIYVRSQKAGERVMKSVTEFLEKKLKLRVNRDKSAVAPVQERKFLGYRLRAGGMLMIAPKSLERAHETIRRLTRRNRGRSLPQIIRELNKSLDGWVVYYRLAAMKAHLFHMDVWLRRKLRCYRLKQRKRTKPIADYLIQLGVEPAQAWPMAKSEKGWWRLSKNPVIHQAMTNQWFDDLGLINLTQRWMALQTS
jgi:RNA-directed DNA polymerase